MKKRILILGAGLMQGAAIRAAKEIGCIVIAVDGNPSAVCANEADLFFPIDLKDTQALLELAKKLKSEPESLHGVFTAATDFSLPVSLIAEHCGLISHTVQAASNASNKIHMRKCFADKQVPSTKFAQIREQDKEDTLQILAANSVEFPVVVKPADNMGARGCKFVHSSKELTQAVNDAIGYSKSKTCIVEEYIDGEEFSLEALVINSEIFITAIADRHIFFKPHFIEMGHTIPSIFERQHTEELIRVFKLGIKALELTNGAAKGDIFLRKSTSKNPKREACIGEIAARLSGGYMSGWTVPYSSGLNVTKAALQIALGEPVKELQLNKCVNILPLKENILQFEHGAFCAERAWISIDGIIDKIYGQEQAEQTAGVQNVLPKTDIGDEVCFPKNNVEKCGNILCKARTYRQAVLNCEQAIKKIVLRLTPNNNKTNLFLSNFNQTVEAQDNYPPNFFHFPNSFENNFEDALTKSRLIKKDDIIFPNCFENVLDTVFDLHKYSIREAIQKAFYIEPKLKQLLQEAAKTNNTLSEKQITLWKNFIRAGIQGLLYSFDSFFSQEEAAAPLSSSIKL